MADGATTTFIPKRIDPAATSLTTAGATTTRRPATGILNVVAIIIFIAALISAGGVYLYKSYLTSTIADMKASIDRAEKSFEPSLILDLVRLDARLRTSSVLLKQHIGLSSLFRTIEESALPEVSFTAFQFEYDDGVPTVHMQGLASRYTPIAQQSEILGQSNLIVDHIFSNFALTPAGRVSFDLNFTLNPDLMLYDAQYQPVVTPQAAPQTAPVVQQQSQTQTTTSGQGQSSDQPLSWSLQAPSLDGTGATFTQNAGQQ